MLVLHALPKFLPLVRIKCQVKSVHEPLPSNEKTEVSVHTGGLQDVHIPTLVAEGAASPRTRTYADGQGPLAKVSRVKKVSQMRDHLIYRVPIEQEVRVVVRK
jgi:hypothetical protein